MHKKISPKIIPLFLAVFIVVFAMTFALFQRTALANFVVNAWQGYRLNSGLVGYWSFDGKDISGTTVYDRSGQGNNGTLTNGPAATIGKIGQAFNFFPGGADTDAYVNIGDPVSGALDFGSGDFSVGLWMKGAGYSSQGSSVNVILAKRSYNGAGAGYGFSYASTNKLDFVISNGTTLYYASSVLATVNDNTWHYYLGLRSGNVSYLYIDGVLSGTTTVSGSASTNIGLVVGSDGVTSRNTNGVVDDVRIYSRALSPEEVQRLYLMGASLKMNVTHRDELTSGLMGEWTFDGKDMIPNVRDVSGQGNHGCLQNQNPTTTTVGKIGQGLSFDGVDDYVTIPDSASVNPSASISLSACVKTSSTTLAQTVIGKYKSQGNDREYWLSIGNGTNAGVLWALVSADGVGANTRISSATVNDGNWHFITMTFSATGIVYPNVYVDGVLSNGATSGANNIGSLFNGAVPLTISSVVNTSGVRVQYFDGFIDEVRVYDRVLSPEEVQRLYLMGASLKMNVTHRDELTSGLMGEWTFDGKDMMPNVRDVSGQGNHGGLQNQNPTTTTIGKIGQALRFDGVNDSVNAGTGASLNITGQMTIAAWIYPTNFSSGGARGRIVDKGSTLFICDNSNVANGLSFSTDGANVAVSAANIVVQNKWQHVLVTYGGAGTAPAFYVDGVFKGISVTTPSAPVGNSNPYYIGNSAANTRQFTGSIDDLRVYNRILSIDEIRRLYLMGE